MQAAARSETEGNRTVFCFLNISDGRPSNDKRKRSHQSYAVGRRVMMCVWER